MKRTFKTLLIVLLGIVLLCACGDTAPDPVDQLAWVRSASKLELRDSDSNEVTLYEE